MLPKHSHICQYWNIPYTQTRYFDSWQNLDESARCLTYDSATMLSNKWHDRRLSSVVSAWDESWHGTVEMTDNQRSVLRRSAVHGAQRELKTHKQLNYRINRTWFHQIHQPIKQHKHTNSWITVLTEQGFIKYTSQSNNINTPTVELLY